MPRSAEQKRLKMIRGVNKRNLLGLLLLKPGLISQVPMDEAVIGKECRFQNDAGKQSEEEKQIAHTCAHTKSSPINE